MQIERHTLVAVATRNYNTQLIKKNQTKNNHIYHSIALIISESFSIQQKQDNGTNNGYN